MKNIEKSFQRLINIITKLRSECPWDREQTMTSLRQLTLEETYELTEAILRNDITGIKEELGDLIMHTVFYAKIAEEENHFNLEDVLDGIQDKLIRRHPHVFEHLKVKDSNAVKTNWEKIKLKEKKRENASVLSGLPSSLPALIKSQRLQAKAVAVGFDWERKEDIWQKVQEEIAELKTEMENSNSERKSYEFGDVIFALVNAARLYDVDAEVALEKTNIEFIRRFRHIEKRAIEKGTTIDKLPFNEMDKYWNEAKKKR